jgi:hypothetical protein
MGITYEYYGEDNVAISEIERVYELAQTSFFPFTGFSSERFVMGTYHPETLPSLGSFKGFNIKEITTHGTIKKNNRPLEKLKSILKEGEKPIGGIGALSISWHFKEKGSADMKRCDDSFRIDILSGKKYFGYRSNASKVSLDRHYAIQFFKNLKSAAGLPYDVVEGADYYQLKHTQSGELKYHSSMWDKNPTAFSCEIMDKTVDELFDHMQRAFEALGTDKFNKFNWGAFSGPIDDPALNLKIYQVVYEKKFPADKYDIRIDYALNGVSDIEELRQLCGPKDRVFTGICSFHLSEDNYANMDVITKRKGHRIVFSLRLPQDTKQIVDRLGVKIKKSYFV